MTRSYGVDSAISKVPAKFIDDVGLQFDRMKWRRKRGRFDSALEIIEKFSAKPDLLVKPELWMKEKFIIARKNIDDKKYKEAYELFINHGITDISGLTFIGDILYMISDDNNFIVSYDTNKKKILRKDKLPKKFTQEGITFDNKGNLFIADDKGQILKIKKYLEE